MIISYNIPNDRHHQIHLPHPLPPAKSIRAPLLHQQSWSPYISHIIMIILPTLHVAPSRSPRCSSGGASRAKWNSTPSSWTGCSPSHILDTYAMRFFGSSMAWCLGKAYNPRCHQGIFQRGTMTKSSRGASKRSCSQTAPSVPGALAWKMKRLMQQKKRHFGWNDSYLGSPNFWVPCFFNDGSQPPSLRRQWGVRGYFTTRFPGTSTCEGILTTSFLWWQRQIL